MIEKLYIIAFLVLYFLVVFIIPSIRVKCKTGINPYVFKKSDSAHDYLGKVSTPITSLIFIVAILNLLLPNIYHYFVPFTWLELASITYSGFILIHLALIWIVIAQLQMDNSWRIGIDDSAKTELKTNGLFSISRNPVFLGMLVTLLGIFLIMPNAVTLLTLVTSTLLFQVQVRLEEEHLKKVQGIAYLEYCKKVKRWIMI